MNVNQMHFSDIYELVDFVKKNYEYGKYIFRGQPQPWELKSSLYRISDYNTQQIEDKKTVRFGNWVLNNPYLKPIHEPNEQLFAIAQHHGFKTDLIDFTLDIEVAAFFATNDPDKEGNSDIDISTKGVIWAISIDEFSKYIDRFAKDNLLKNYSIKGLWRLENQKGLFVWDKGGCFSSIVGDDADFTFTHIKDKPYLTDRISKDYIYPEPNDLEREIQRFKYYNNIVESQKFFETFKRRPNARSYTIEAPDIEGLDLIATDKYDWKHPEWLSINQISYENIVFNENVHEVLINSIGVDELLLSFLKVSQYATSLQSGEKVIPTIKIELKDKSIYINNIKELEELISNAIFTMIQYPYKASDIATALTFLTKYYYEKNKPENINISNKQIARLVYDADIVLELEAGDTLSVCTRFYVIKDFFKNIESMTRLRDSVNSKYSDINLSSNLEVFTLVTKPEKLFSFDKAIELWSKYVFPYQFIFRKEGYCIYAPVNISAIGLP